MPSDIYIFVSAQKPKHYMENSHLLSHEHALEFILGGNALFTARNSKTGTRFTYKILKHHEIPNLLKVNILSGPDNYSNYREIGYIKLESGLPLFQAHDRFKGSDSAIFLAHIMMYFSINRPMPSLEIFHFGRCCRCGKLLTVPESIINGIGPECIKRVSLINRSLGIIDEEEEDYENA